MGMTNYEKIKGMSIEEMAVFLNVSDCYRCAFYTEECGHCTTDCEEGIKKWLRQKVEG